ncbi:MAG TPA: hypothetical protein VNA14_06155 [Mycobacteriales bacterium]|nr:hypothetical protein [Mycobacteriales bacterium]
MSTSVCEMVIRPSAILPVAAAARIVERLRDADVSTGGLWNATTSVWQRYDRRWDGVGGSRGSAELVGSIAVIYDSPRSNEITIYKVTLTPQAAEAGWTTELLCNDALSHAGLTLDTCPRAALAAPPPPDPFKSRNKPDVDVPEQRSIWQTEVSSLLRSDVKQIFRRL